MDLDAGQSRLERVAQGGIGAERDLCDSDRAAERSELRSLVDLLIALGVQPKVSEIQWEEVFRISFRRLAVARHHHGLGLGIGAQFRSGQEQSDEDEREGSEGS